ncbi:glutamate--tRNA ligase [Patescibacteria group bacterium]|nr:glutamate--tRNA ligase [Patescibacteria group bacterium]
MSQNTPIRTRIAPSPTGQMHIGTLRTLLYNYAFAKKHHGQFIIRIEDTDQKRLVPGTQQKILDVIKRYGISWDEGPDIGGPYGPYVQTERLAIYQKYIKRLLDRGQAYYCFCSPARLEKMRLTQTKNKQVPRYDRHCLSLSPAKIAKNLKQNKPYVIRLRVPQDQKIICQDFIRGKIVVDSRQIDDQVLLKSNGIPTYHFAVVIDDHLMKISHVLRGDEWLASLPKQVILYQYLKWKPPIFVHLPVILNPNGRGKMSKRFGSVSAQSFLDRGYLPSAVNNFLMLLGWNPGTDQELFTLKDFIDSFNLQKLHKTQPVFDIKKLDYLNGLHIRRLTVSRLSKILAPFLPAIKEPVLEKLTPLLKERIEKLSEAHCFTDFIYQKIDYPVDLLLQRGADKKLALDMLTQARDALAGSPNWHFQLIQQILLDLIAKNEWNTGRFFMVFRVAICASPCTLPVVDVLPIIGQKKTIDKLNFALAKLS